MRGRVFGALVTLGVSTIVAGTGVRAADGTAAAAVPRFDHVVVVVEENHAEQQIIGNPDAPFITALAAQNANLTHSFAITHPSQPNYLALFSGSTQNVTDDGCPYSFTGANLATNLASAGLGFAGYSEDQPSVGYAGCGYDGYVRKHNPWVDFPALASTINQPLTAFPTDYAALPAVSYVVPNLTDDMHDGTVAQGDSWLQQHLSGYVTWARTHNSLFVLTFDEDDDSAGNQIATVIAGANVVPGAYTETINHYNVLSTIAQAAGVTAPGNAATAAPITDIWSPAAFVTDTFNRVVAGGWGSADTGGAYSHTGTLADFAAASGNGRIRLSRPGTMYGALLPSASSASSDVLTTVSLDKLPAGGPVYAYVVGRRVAATTDYQARLLITATGTLQLFLARTVAGTTTLLTSKAKTVAGVRCSAGSPLSVRLQVTGTNPTTLRARVWSGVEPTAWTVSATDGASALQAAGYTGLVADLDRHARNAPVTVSVRGFSAQP